MINLLSYWVGQVEEGVNGAAGGNSPREAGSSDELWAQMQVFFMMIIMIMMFMMKTLMAMTMMNNGGGTS